MSDNIPFDIQVQILKKLPVKSLLQFRSVSKIWKALIDSPQFITSYSAQGSQVQHLLVNLISGEFDKYYLITEDDSFPQLKVSVPPPDKFVDISHICGCSHGLLCFLGYTGKAVIWNPSIRKAVSVLVQNVEDEVYECNLDFGVCRETMDSKIVKIRHVKHWVDIQSIASIPQQVEVFTLSTRGWRSSYGNLPRKTIQFSSYQCVEVGGFLYWLATDWIADGWLSSYNLIVSFDLTSEEFSEVKIPDSLANMVNTNGLTMYKVRESLVVVHRGGAFTDFKGSIAWMMQDGVSKSFTKMFTFDTPYACIRGFQKSGEPVIKFEEVDAGDLGLHSVYDPHLKHIQIDDLGIHETGCYYLLFHYIETLLLLDHPDLVVYNDI